MRKMNLKYMFVALVILSTTVSCSLNNDNNPPPVNPQILLQLKNTVSSGNWRITKFVDSDTVETSHFTGFDFTFDSNGTLTAMNTSDTFQGTWSITNSNTSDDNSSTDNFELNINFNLTNDFQDLNNDWTFLTASSNKIELIDESGGNGGTDYLTFEKN